jgi:hypothetical protein
MLFDLIFPCYLTTFSGKKCLSGKVICTFFWPAYRSSPVVHILHVQSKSWSTGWSNLQMRDPATFARFREGQSEHRDPNGLLSERLVTHSDIFVRLRSALKFDLQLLWAGRTPFFNVLTTKADRLRISYISTRFSALWRNRMISSRSYL